MRKRKTQGKLISGEYFGTDEDIYEEFSLLKEILLDAGYARYELSNFAQAGKSGIHNRVYWQMENYLGLGLNSASFLGKDLLSPELLSQMGVEGFDAHEGMRFKNTTNFDQYLEGSFLEKSAFELMSMQDYLVEEFFLSLRTDSGIADLARYQKILIAQAEQKLELYEQQGLILRRGG